MIERTRRQITDKPVCLGLPDRVPDEYSRYAMYQDMEVEDKDETFCMLDVNSARFREWLRTDSVSITS